MELAIYLFITMYCIGIGIAWYILSNATDSEYGADPPCYLIIVLGLSLIFPLTFIVIGLWELGDRIKRLIIG